MKFEWSSYTQMDCIHNWNFYFLSNALIVLLVIIFDSFYLNSLHNLFNSHNPYQKLLISFLRHFSEHSYHNKIFCLVNKLLRSISSNFSLLALDNHLLCELQYYYIYFYFYLKFNFLSFAFILIGWIKLFNLLCKLFEPWVSIFSHIVVILLFCLLFVQYYQFLHQTIFSFFYLFLGVIYQYHCLISLECFWFLNFQPIIQVVFF